jgi:hypothetical protein
VIIIDINAFNIESSRVAESAVFLRKDKFLWLIIINSFYYNNEDKDKNKR